MKRILYVAALLCAFDFAAFGQGSAPLKVREVDGSPSKSGITTIVVSNGTLTISGTTATIATGGGSGTPGGNDTELQYNNAGSFGGITGATTNGTFVTLTTPVLGVASATSVTASAAGLAFSGTNTTDNASVQAILLQGDRATVAGNDEAYATLRMSNAAGTQTEVARITWAIPTATAASEAGRIDFSVMTGGALAKELQLAGADLSPSSNDGLALGNSGSLEWSDLFLASGAVIGFNAGDVTITHSANLLTVAGGNVIISSPGSAGGSVTTIDGSQTLTNKTITASSNVLGGVTMTLGSDADGDIYYRASNVLTRLPKGTALQQLRMNAGATAPEWATISGGGLTVGTTTITSGTDTRVLYNNAGTLGEYAVTGSTNIVMSTSPTITTPAITTTATVTRDSVGVTSTDGIILQNTTAAAAGAQQYSPRLRLTGQGWKTNATAASQDVNWIHEVQPVQAAANPTSLYVISSSVNGGAYTRQFAMTSASANRLYGDNTTPYLELSSGNGSILYYGTTGFVAGGAARVDISGTNTEQWSSNSANVGPSVVRSWAATGAAGNAADTYLRRNGAANIGLGATTSTAAPVAQTISVESVVGGTTNTAGASFTIQGSLGTSQGAPGVINLQTGAMIAATGSTQQTAVSRLAVGPTKVLTNNSATAIVNVTAATETNAAGVIDYAVEVLDGTDVQYEVGSVAYGVSNKGGVFSGNTATKFGNHQNATSGTLTVTFAISGANPAVLSVNANSSLSPSTGYPRITYTLRNLTQQAVAIQ